MQCVLACLLACVQKVTEDEDIADFLSPVIWSIHTYMYIYLDLYMAEERRKESERIDCQ